MDLTQVLGLVMRVIHIGSVVVFVGALFYLWGARQQPAPLFRGMAWGTAALILLSGVYNLLAKSLPPGFQLPPAYHMWFGIKFLLALHVMAIGLLLYRNQPNAGKTQRLLTGAVISATLVIIIAGYLRYLSTPQMAIVPSIAR
jgi:hypothetical protein